MTDPLECPEVVVEPAFPWYVALWIRRRVLGGGIAVAGAAQTTPGTPGDANCQGQHMALIAQALKGGGAPGIGNVSDLTGYSVKEIKAMVAAYCA